MTTWAPVPDSRKGTKVQGYGGHYVIIFKESKNKEAMFKIAEFLNTNTACDIIFKNVGWLPGLKPYLEHGGSHDLPRPGLLLQVHDRSHRVVFAGPLPDHQTSPARSTRSCARRCTAIR